ncbi:hypothetical protein [Burkholderia ubonensis]|uniref:hypothetical protein n=1 Tax=Burkholderia ubonensis TaxID=101571 RepID=UPI00097108DF|nr:hypothetical protein [Burkholderia ubonensis]
MDGLDLPRALCALRQLTQLFCPRVDDAFAGAFRIFLLACRWPSKPSRKCIRRILANMFSMRSGNTTTASFLHVLDVSEDTDVAILVDYLTDNGKGRLMLDGDVRKHLEERKLSGSFDDGDRRLIGNEIRTFGGNTLAHADPRPGCHRTGRVNRRHRLG